MNSMNPTDSKLVFLYSKLHECVREYFRVEHVRSEQELAAANMREVMEAVTEYIRYWKKREEVTLGKPWKDNSLCGVPVQLELELELELEPKPKKFSDSTDIKEHPNKLSAAIELLIRHKLVLEKLGKLDRIDVLDRLDSFKP